MTDDNLKDITVLYLETVKPFCVLSQSFCGKFKIICGVRTPGYPLLECMSVAVRGSQWQLVALSGSIHDNCRRRCRHCLWSKFCLSCVSKLLKIEKSVGKSGKRCNTKSVGGGSLIDLRKDEECLS